LIARLMERDLLAVEDGYEPLVGGRTNDVWKVVGQTRDAVLKLYQTSLQNPLFPNDPDLEQLCLKELAKTKLAPQLLAHGCDHGQHWVLYGHAPGGCWVQNAAPVARLLYDVHATVPPADLPAGRNGSEDLKQQTLRILAGCTSQTRSVIERLVPHRNVPPTSGTRFIHGDPVPGNILVQNENAMLIDWQCPALGDPAEDLAVFLSPAMQVLYRGSVLTQEDVEQFLTAYPDIDTTDRYQALKPWYHWRMAAYCLWRHERGASDYQQALSAELTALRAC